MNDDRDRQPERDFISVGSPVQAAFSTETGPLRMSLIIKRLRAQDGGERAVRAVEDAYAKVGKSCPVHGELHDPILGLLDGDLAFICPDCSAPEIKARWEQEGRRDG